MYEQVYEHVCTHMETRDQSQILFCHLLCFQRQVFTGTQGSLIGLGWLASEPQDPPLPQDLHFPSTGIKSVHHGVLLFTWVQGIELRSS